ncbi:MAG: tRNA pseudouridine(38-40) synthase TruA [Pedobacter sp.]|nr:MAG: tRNA pseudouridine(38-40) synthase TruA [Pedobacter sp.]
MVKFAEVEKKRYFIELSYDGTLFHGWQTQPNAETVQARIDAALSIYFRQTIESLGCGRTDTGVHAHQFFAHFDLDQTLAKPPQAWVSGLNALLPRSIAIKQVFEVSSNAHARFDAASRTYDYHIHFHKDPFKQQRSWQYKGHLNVPLMQEAANTLADYEDFTSFSKLHTQTFTNNCKIYQAVFKEKKDGSLVFTISADRFLRNMVRAIVGTLVEVGKGQIDVTQFREIIKSKSRSNAGQSVPACGLYLVNVTYPYVKH